MFFLQESCARMLLFRGADKECLNYAGQTAYQVRQCDKVWRGHKSYLYTMSALLPNIPLRLPGRTAHNTISKSHRYFGLYLTLPTLRTHHTPIHSKFPKTSKYPNQTIISSPQKCSVSKFAGEKNQNCAIQANSLHI